MGKLIVEDPFHRKGVTKYTITKFTPTKVAEGLESYLETVQTDFSEGYCPKNNIKKESITFILHGGTFPLRLLLGATVYPMSEILKQSVQTVQLAMITVSLHRASSGGKAHGRDFQPLLKEMGVPILPNIAGCQSVQKAVITAQVTRGVFDTDWIRLELIGDDDTLQPDVFRLVETAEILIKDGFKVLSYCTEDLITRCRLLDAGYQALMPWAAPTDAGLDAVRAYALKVLCKRLPDTPLIVDTDLGLPSQVAQVMEQGFDGVLLNTAVSHSDDPVDMARAFTPAVESDRLAYEAEPAETREKARASTLAVGQSF